MVDHAVVMEEDSTLTWGAKTCQRQNRYLCKVRIKPLILLLLMMKVSLTTGLCSTACHVETSESSCTTEVVTSKNSCCQAAKDQNSDHKSSTDDSCSCACCTVLSYVLYETEDKEELVAETSTVLPEPYFHDSEHAHSVFHPPCLI